MRDTTPKTTRDKAVAHALANAREVNAVDCHTLIYQAYLAGASSAEKPAQTVCGVAESIVNKVSRHHTAMMERFLEGFLSAEVVKQYATDPMKTAMLISETVRTHELCMDYDHEKGVARYWIRPKDKEFQK